MIFSGKTDKGRLRPNNEDAFFMPENLEEPLIFIVADGMGGHNGGEVASQIAVEEISSYIYRNKEKFNEEEEIKKIIKEAICHANSKILEKASSDIECSGMGTTSTLAVVFCNKLYIGHIGDCRLYLIRGKNITQVTKDHSLVWELMEQGKINFEEMKVHPMKHIITKALGIQDRPEPDILTLFLEKDDIIIICSDGLTAMLSDMEIKDIALKYKNPETISQILVDLANDRGGYDNVTVVTILVD